MHQFMLSFSGILLRYWSIGLLCCSVTALTACGGAQSSQNSLPATTLVSSPVAAFQTIEPKPEASQPYTQTTVTYTLATNAGRVTQGGASYSGYTSTAAPVSISLNITPLGGATSNYTGSCTTDSTGTVGTCIVTFMAAPGPTTISGTLSEGGNVVANFSNLSIIQPITANSLNFTAKPVVSSVVLQLGASSVNAGTPSNVPLAVNAMDANGKIIVGTASYVDLNGNPIALLLNVSNNQIGGKGTVTIQGPSRISAPNQSLIYAHYDGKWLASSTISVTSTSSVVTSLTGATLSTIPQVFEYTAPGGPGGIIAGPDGNLWFTEQSANAIGRMTTNGSNYNAYGCSPCVKPSFLVVGADGNVWFTEFNGTHYTDKISTSGIVTRVAANPNHAVRPVVGPDGNIWVAAQGGAGGEIDEVTPSGILTSYYIPAGGYTSGITLGPDGNLWYSAQMTKTVGSLTTGGVFANSYTIGNNTYSIDNLVTGPDKNLWLANYSSNLIDKITLGGTVTPYALQSGAKPYDIIVGPDANLWFTENGTNSIGSLTSNGTLTEYGASFGINASAGPMGITVGPDGNIWFAENGSNTIAKFVF